jgi:hypothetical protein
VLANVQSGPTALKHTRLGAGRAAALRGTIAWPGRSNNASPLRTDLDLANFAVRPSQAMLARYGRVLNDALCMAIACVCWPQPAMRRAAHGAAKAFFNGINAGAVRVAA